MKDNTDSRLIFLKNASISNETKKSKRKQEDSYQKVISYEDNKTCRFLFSVLILIVNRVHKFNNLISMHIKIRSVQKTHKRPNGLTLQFMIILIN